MPLKKIEHVSEDGEPNGVGASICRDYRLYNTCTHGTRHDPIETDTDTAGLAFSDTRPGISRRPANRASQKIRDRLKPLITAALLFNQLQRCTQIFFACRTD